MIQVKYILFGLSIVFANLLVEAQYGSSEGVSISNDASPPHPSAILDVSAIDKGILIPKVFLIDALTSSPVSNPETSLLVYNTNPILNDGIGFYFWNGEQWSSLFPSARSNEDWKVIGENGTMDNGESIPSFENPLITTISSLEPVERLAIRKRNDGIVEISGAFDVPVGMTNLNLILFKLPLGYTGMHSSDPVRIGLLTIEGTNTILGNDAIMILNGDVFIKANGTSGKRIFLEISF